MAIKHEIILDLDLILTRVDGVVDDNATYESEELLSTIEGFKSNFNQLADARLVTENLITTDGLFKVGTVTPFDHNVKRAYVVNDKLASMYATLFGITASSGENYFVTYNIEEACDWLDIPYDVVMAASIYGI